MLKVIRELNSIRCAMSVYFVYFVLVSLSPQSASLVPKVEWISVDNFFYNNLTALCVCSIFSSFAAMPKQVYIQSAMPVAAAKKVIFPMCCWLGISTENKSLVGASYQTNIDKISAHTHRTHVVLAWVPFYCFIDSVCTPKATIKSETIMSSYYFIG